MRNSKGIDLQALLEHAAEAAGAPGCAAAIWHDGEIAQAATGFANAVEGAPATSNTAFPIGSITKPFTATLALQLVDEGKLTLETTLAEMLPELSLSDADAAQRITLRHLLNHTNGIDGDFMVDTGEGNDHLVGAITEAAGTNVLHDPGACFSYSNLAFIFVGRIVEKYRGMYFDDALQRFIFDPLKLTTPVTAFGPTRAVGHYKKDDEWALVPGWPRSNTPSGSRLAMSADDLVRFAGVNAMGGAPLLEAATAHAMHEISIETPLLPRCDGWGLGWMRFNWSGKPMFGHDGGITGCAAFMRIAPEARFAVTLMVNGGNYALLYRTVMKAVMAHYLVIDAPPPNPTPDPSHIPNSASLLGRYERRGLFAEVIEQDGKIALRVGGEYGDPNEPIFAATPAKAPLFFAAIPGSDSVMPFYFLHPDAQGIPQYLHFQDRIYNRVKP